MSLFGKKQNENEELDVYKTSKTTWYVFGFLAMIIAIVIFMIYKNSSKHADYSAELQCQIVQ
jgi:hypothetical protein